MDDQREHWLVRPASIRRLWIGFVVVLVLSVVAELAIDVKGYFGVDELPAFAAVFGFLACAALVLIAKGVGPIVKRGEAYYRDDRDYRDYRDEDEDEDQGEERTP